MLITPSWSSPIPPTWDSFPSHRLHRYRNIQIKHISEGISKNYPHKVPLEKSNMPEAIAKGVWTVSKIPSVVISLTPEQTDVHHLFYKMMFYNYAIISIY